MIQAVLIMGGLGVFVGAGLAIASKVFYVYVDPKVIEVEEALPGANCGGCGLPGCSANAEAIIAGKASPNSCIAGGPELVEIISNILGVSVEVKESDIAKPGCTYNIDNAETKYVYDGIDDCRAATLLSGGMKVCDIGCLGLGTCAKACPFDALVIGPSGLPIIDEAKCTGCGTCEKVCPKNIINLSSVTRRILLEYTSDYCTTPCQMACPAGINIKEYIRQINLGEYRKAIQVIKERNPFPTTIGRICPRPCELDCRRKYIDEPVAINFLKRFVADYEREVGERILPFKAPSTNRKIAVIGGGIAGLSAAFFSARLGHSPTVFEASSKLGGLLRSAISKSRLPEDILDWDIQGILDMGVRVEINKTLGTDFTIDSLLADGFEAVLLASGGWDSRLARSSTSVVEKQVPDTYMILDLIKNEDQISCKSNVVILGKEKSVIEAAKLCIKKGAEKVTILCRESKGSLPILNDDASSLNGIDILYNKAVKRLVGVGNELTEIEYVDFRNSLSTIIPANTLLLSTGRFPELVFKKYDLETIVSIKSDNTLQTDKIRWEGVQAYKEEIGLMANSDALSDYNAAIKAIAIGRRTAATVHNMIYGIKSVFSDNVHFDIPIQNIDSLENVQTSKRNIMPISSPKELSAGYELEKGFDDKTARDEAKRCLQCGSICYEKIDELGRKVASSAA